MNIFAYRRNPTTLTFIVQNVKIKWISIFNNPVAPNGYIDLMKIRGISEEEIKSSLIKGELYHKIRTKSIKVFQSNVNLTSFDPTFTAFLNNAGITTGTGSPHADSQNVVGTYTCGLDVNVNSVVYLASPDFVDLAHANNPTTQPLIGIVQSKPNQTTAIVMYYGELTGQSGLIPSATYYLDVIPGGYTTNPPSATGLVVQKIGFAKDPTTLVLFIDRDFVVL